MRIAVLASLVLLLAAGQVGPARVDRTQAALTALPPRSPVVAIIKSADSEPYRDAARGFIEAVKAEYPSAKFVSFVIGNGDPAKVTRKAAAEKPDLVGAIGTAAAKAAKQKFRKTPVVFSLVVDPKGHGLVASERKPGGNVTGVRLEIAPSDQTAFIREMLPKARTVGMIYSDLTWLNRTEAENAATRASFKLNRHKVASRVEIAAALRKVVADSDVLLAQPDNVVYTPASAELMLKTTHENRMPFVAFSTAYVKAGALACIYSPPYDNGKQAGKMAAALLGGKSPANTAVQWPDNPSVGINLLVAERIGVKIPGSIVKRASFKVGK